LEKRIQTNKTGFNALQDEIKKINENYAEQYSKLETLKIYISTKETELNALKNSIEKPP